LIQNFEGVFLNLELFADAVTDGNHLFLRTALEKRRSPKEKTTALLLFQKPLGPKRNLLFLEKSRGFGVI